MTDFYIKHNDTSPSLSAAISKADSSAVDLTGATVTFRMTASIGGVLKVNAAATIVNATSGQVRYDWVAANTDTTGDYLGEFRIVFADGTISTAPNDSQIAIHVVAQVTG